MTFMGSRYADYVASIVSKNGFDVYLSDRPSTTPAIFWSVKALTLTGGIMITAGDSPYEYNGVKICTLEGYRFSPHYIHKVSHLR